MPRARTRLEELLKWQMRLPTTPTFCNARGGGKGFPSGGPGGYLAAEPSKLISFLLLPVGLLCPSGGKVSEPSKLNKTLSSMKLPA